MERLFQEEGKRVLPLELQSLTLEHSTARLMRGETYAVGDLREFTSLRSLSIHASMVNYHGYDSHDPVFFPRLESLYISTGPDEDFYDPTSLSWSRFMRLQGANIKYLNIDCVPQRFQALLDVCSALEHLVVSVHKDLYRVTGQFEHTLKHPTVKYLDLRYWLSQPPPLIQELADKPLQHFPSLICIRSIDDPVMARSLPLKVSPHLQSDANYEPFEFHFPGIHIRCEGRQVVRLDLLADELNEDDNDDDDYEYASEEESSSLSDDEQSDSGADSASSTADKLIDHEEALLIFNRLLEVSGSDDSSLSEASDSD